MDSSLRGPRVRRRSGISAHAAGWPGGLLLLLIGLAVYLPGLRSLPVVDRDEARFAQASRQMAASARPDDWVVPRVQDRPRLNKPPLIYWLQAAAARAAGAHRDDPADPWARAALIWPFRIPSILAALIAVLATWRIGVTMFDARAGWLGGLLLAVCPLMIWESKQARADMVLLASTTVAMWMVWALYRRRRENEAGHPHAGARLLKQLVLWTAIAAGVMTKGPVTLIVVGPAVLFIGLMTRRWRWIGGLRPVPGVLLVAALLGAWVWMVARQVGWSEYTRIVTDEVLGRSVAPKEGHWGPPGYHLILLSLLLWPGSLLTATALGRAFHRGVRGEPSSAPGRIARWRAWWRTRHGGRRDELFCLAWILPAWIIFELVGTKLPHYTLPLYPPIALLSARAVLAAAAGSLTRVERTRCKAGFVVWLLLGLGLAVAGPVALWWIAARAEEQWLAGWAIAAGIGALVALLLSVRWLRRRRFIAVQLAGVAALAISGPVLVGVLLPRLDDIWVTRQLQRSIAAVDPRARRPIAAVGYHEDSLIFMTGGRAQRLNADQLAEWISAHPDGLVIAPVSEAPDGLRRLDTVSGFNYSKGDRVRLMLADRAP